MIIEKWSHSTSPVLILRNDEKGLLYNHVLQTKSYAEQKRLLQEEGQPLATLRKALLEQEANRTVTINPVRLQRFLENRGERESISKVKTIDFSKFHMHTKAIFNELTFIGASVAQGFIEFYGIEMAGIVEAYERRLRIIEEEEMETGKRSVYIGKISQGNVRYFSPNLETIESAQETLRHFQEKQAIKNRVATDSPSIALTRKREDDPYEKE
ncbi:hypothetical protein [Jeotgalibaca caeni]|uniref:hypothetical protein n=1 Tax=Jeotgalibaca caeni TaxID=3028623 RepID=UPI00237DDBEE|nr:hypothetical protein [Jeotgalibaca caeni]MDE1548531.1 hypothetical protein [Jeotgalibaca caeni]